MHIYIRLTLSPLSISQAGTIQLQLNWIENLLDATQSDSAKSYWTWLILSGEREREENALG